MSWIYCSFTAFAEFIVCALILFCPLRMKKPSLDRFAFIDLHLYNYFVIFDRQIIFSSTKHVHFFPLEDSMRWYYCDCCRCRHSFSFTYFCHRCSHLIDLYDSNRIVWQISGDHMHSKIVETVLMFTIFSSFCSWYRSMSHGFCVPCAQFMNYTK